MAETIPQPAGPEGARAPKFNLITDTCCDLTRPYLDAHGVRVCHFTYAEAGKPDGGFSGTDDLFESRTAHEFYDAIREGAAPMTSQPSPGEFERVFREAMATGLPSVYLCFTSGLSGCYEGALSVARQLLDEQRAAGRPDSPLPAGADGSIPALAGDGARLDPPIYILDTRFPSTPFGLLVTAAVRHIESADPDAAELVRWSCEAIPHIHTVFLVDDLRYLARGGRMPPSAAKIGSALGVKPLLSVDLQGKLTFAGIARGRKKCMSKFVSLFRANRSRASEADKEAYPSLVFIGNADCPEDAPTLEAMLREVEPGIEVVVTSIGPTIGCHVGPGMLSCCCFAGARKAGDSGV